MFCPECGKENKDDSIYCASCGAELSEGQSAASASAKDIAKEAKAWFSEKVLPFFNQKALPFAKKYVVEPVKKHKGIAIAALCAVVLIAVFGVVTSGLYSPQSVAESYVKAIMEERWDDAYDKLSIVQNELVNYESFAAYQENCGIDFDSVMNYDVRDVTGSEDSLVRTYEVAYVETGSSYENTFTVRLVRQDEKALLVFPTYKVSTDTMLASCSVETVAGSTVLLNGVEISGDYTAEQAGDESYVVSDSYDIFYLPPIFEGVYDITVTHPLCEDYVSTVEIYDGSYLDFSYYMEISSVQRETIASIAQQAVEALCDGAITGKSLDQLGLPLTADEEYLAYLEDAYADLISELKNSDGTGLKSITFESFSDYSYGDVEWSDNTYLCEMGFEYNYVSLYKGWFDEEISEYTSSYSRDGSFDITFRFEDGDWKIISLDGFWLYYYS